MADLSAGSILMTSEAVNEEGKSERPVSNEHTPVGFFRDLPYGIPDQPTLAEAEGGLDDQLLDRVARYLRSGGVRYSSPSISHDARTHDPIGPLRILTDGVYDWPSDLAHYVTTSRTALPEEFLDHMRSRGWTVANEPKA